MPAVKDHTMPSVIGECTPLQSSKKRTSFATNSWILSTLALCLSVTLVGFILHWHHVNLEGLHRQVQVKVTTPAPKSMLRPSKAVNQRVPKKPRNKAHKPHHFAFPGTRYFKQCNPSLSYDRPGRPPLPVVFEKKFCRSEQAAIINNIFDRERYSFDAMVPDPYIYPAHVLETLVAMGPEQLEAYLAKYWHSAAKLGKLGTLVKVFAWGIPVTMQELDSALGDDSALSALDDCGIIVRCEASTQVHVVSSAVQLFPVQHTSIMVATDWSLPYVASEKKAIKPVHAVDVHDIFIIQNMPRFPRRGGGVEDIRVLNLESGSGVLGLAAADRGASAVLLDPNPRAAAFARFNSWVNLLTSRAEVYERDLMDVFKLFPAHDFYMLLSHPVGNNPLKVEFTIKVALESSKAILPPDKGMSIISFEGQRCEDFTRKYNKNFCGENVEEQTFSQAQGNHADLSGSVICRHPSGDHSDVMAKESMVFAWRGIPELERDRPMDLDRCGHFDTIRLDSFIGSGGVRACKFFRPDMQCAQSEDFAEPE